MKATHIVVISSGWVFAGTLAERHTITAPYVLEDAACIRKWGTTRGLGELALSGPTAETVLDPCGRLETHVSQVLFTLRLEPSKWR